MSNKFPIEITAVDKTGKVFEQVARNGKKLAERLRGLKGLKPLGQGLSNMGASGRLAQLGSRGLDAIGSGSFAPMISGVGLASAGTAALVASLASLTFSTASRATSLKNLAARTGLNEKGIQDVQAGAKSLGIDEAVSDSALRSFAAQAHEGANYGNNDLWALLSKRGQYKFERNADGSVNMTRTLRDFADVIASQPNPTLRAKMADAVGLGDLLPLLQGGGRGFDGAIAKGVAARPALTPEELQRAEAADRKKDSVIQSLRHAGDRVGMEIIDTVDGYTKNPTDMIPGAYYWRRYRERKAREEALRSEAEKNYVPSSFDASRDWLTGRPPGAPASAAGAASALDSQVMSEAVKDGMLAAMREGTIKVDEKRQMRPPGPPLRSDYTGRPW